MEIIRKKNGHKEIDLAATFLILLKRAWLIVAAAVIGAMLSLFYSGIFVHPEYEATATLYVSNTFETEEPKAVTTSDLSASMMLMYTCSSMLMGENTMEEVIARTGVAYNSETLQNMIDIYGIDNTKILTITVLSKNPDEAALLANTIAELAPGLMKNVEPGITVKVLDQAKVPKKSMAPGKAKTALLGAVIGAFLAIIVIILKEILDTRIWNKKDILMLGYSLLGVLPVRSEKGKRDETEDLKKPDLQKEIKQIKENVVFSLPGRHCKRILLTGAAQEGVISAAALNLSIELASDQSRVLLVDCDLQHQEIARLAKIFSEPGVTNVLVGQIHPENCIQSYGNNLDVMTSGTFSPDPAKMLCSEEMEQMLEDLSEKYDYIVLNNETFEDVRFREIFYQRATGIILVAHRGVARKTVLREQKDQLDAAGCNIIGLIAASDREL